MSIQQTGIVVLLVILAIISPTPEMIVRIMSMHHIGIVVLLVTLTIISGLADAQGFVHASNIWLDGKIVWPEVIKSALGFGIGIIIYWVCVRFLQDMSIISPELQTIAWFTATIIGVAIFSGKFLHWQLSNQIVGLAVLLGIAWLMVQPTG